METQQRPILIIDDEPSICTGCSLALSDKGYTSDICNTGQAGLKAVLSGRYQLVLLDMKLPDLDGIEILRKVNEARLDVCVIVMTGYANVQNAVESMKLGTFDYLAKPFSDDELLKAVNLAVENRRFKESHIAVRREQLNRQEFSGIIGETPEIHQVFNGVIKVAPTESTVLLNGESGTGKELFAQAIHTHSTAPRVRLSPWTAAPFLRPFWKVNFSVTQKAPLPGRLRTRRAYSGPPATGPFFWMK